MVDCLTLWLTNWMMPAQPSEELTRGWSGQCAAFLDALQGARSVILVGNEIGLGVIPLGSQVRAFVDALGVLNQRAAQSCETVTLMCAGLPLALRARVRPWRLAFAGPGLALCLALAQPAARAAIQVTDGRGVQVELPRRRSASSACPR